MNDALFDLLRTFNLKFCPDPPAYLKCKLCNRVLIDSSFTSCGCTFCADCIGQYLCTGDKICPGGKDICQETILTLASSITKDIPRNVEISYLSVQCPHQNCDNQCQLRKLPEHIVVCPKAPALCIFSDIGCAESGLTAEHIKDHVEENIFNHAKILVTFLSDEKNNTNQHLRSFLQKLIKFEKEEAEFKADLENRLNDIVKSVENINERKLKVTNVQSDLQTSEREVQELRKIIRDMHSEMTEFGKEMRTTKTNLNKSTEETDKLTASRASGTTNSVGLCQEDSDVDSDQIKNPTTKEMETETIVKQEQPEEANPKLVIEPSDKKSKSSEDEEINSYPKQNEELVNTLTKRLDEFDYRQMAIIAKIKEMKALMDSKEDTMMQMNAEFEGKIEEIEKKQEMFIENVTLKLNTFMKETDTIRRREVENRTWIERLIGTVTGENDFIWMIENVHKKYKQLTQISEYSQPFLSDGSDGYKMCLYFRVVQSDAWLTFRLMRGENDSRLQWPMQRRILIEIIDSDTAMPILSRLVSRATAANRKCVESRVKAYERPYDERNDHGDGLIQCFSYDQLKSTGGVFRNDCITVRCRVLLK